MSVKINSENGFFVNGLLIGHNIMDDAFMMQAGVVAEIDESRQFDTLDLLLYYSDAEEC